jgi:hypothetical protein
MIGDIDWFGQIIGGVADGDVGNNARIAKALVRAGLAVVVIEPNGKRPVCILSAADAKKADTAAQDQARGKGSPNWERVRHDCGISHAITEEKMFTRARVKYWFGEGANIAVSPGHSATKIIIVDVDTTEERRAFLADWADATPDSEGVTERPLTVSSPGMMGTQVNGDQVWAHKNGGHYWFTVPEDVTLPERPGKLTWCRCHGPQQPAGGCRNAWAAYYGSGYVLVPPSVRKEGPYRLTGAVELAPEWLTDLIGQTRTPEREDGRTGALSAFDDDPIDAWSAGITWHEILTADGFTPADHDNCGCPTFTRPGDATHSKSVTAHEVGCSQYDTSRGHGPIHVWSDALGTGTMSKLTWIAKYNYGGNTGEAMRALNLATLTKDDGLFELGEIPKGEASHDGAAAGEGNTFEDHFAPIDWDDLFSSQHDTADHLPGQLLERGQQASLVGDGKSGKSLFMAEWCIKVVTGQPFLTSNTCEPLVIMYLDAENSQRDLIMRIRSFGATPDQLRGTLIYLSFPPFKPLDSDDGARQVMALVGKYEPNVVILDTVSRFIKGKENDSDTWLSLYRVLHRRFKALNIACIRLDHFGKDAEKGGRGSSAKSQDIDHVWELSVTGEETKPLGTATEMTTYMDLRRTHTRTGLGPDYMRISRRGVKTDDEWLPGETRHTIADPFNTGTVMEVETVQERPTDLMWQICDTLTENENGLSQTKIEQMVPGNVLRKRYALKLLIDEGNVKKEKRGQAYIHTLIKHVSEQEI